ncbi:hypothetical protein LCGC14_0369470, partial [marine sediment metagenome]
ATRLLYRYSRPYPRPYNIVTARSCPFNCTFCQHSGGAPYRARSIENVIEEIKLAYEKYNFNILIILDELFVANKKRMKDFCNALIEAKRVYGWDFDWMFQTHPNAGLDKESLALAKKAGCYFFAYGMESGSQRILDSMNKKSTVGQAIEAIKLAEEAEVGFGGNFIFGDPAETEETISETLAIYFEHCRTSSVFLGFIKPYPGSRVFDVCMEKGIFKDKRDFYEHIDESIVNMTSLPDIEFQRWVALLTAIEVTWAHIKATSGIYEEDTEAPEVAYLAHNGSKIYKITAVCPYCGQNILYRLPLPHKVDAANSWIGSSCTKCNRRIKVLI